MVSEQGVQSPSHPLYLLFKISSVGPHLLKREFELIREECYKYMIKQLNLSFPNSLYFWKNW